MTAPHEDDVRNGNVKQPPQPQERDLEGGGCCAGRRGRACRLAAVMVVVGAAVCACAAAVWLLLGPINLVQLVLVAAVAYLAASGGFHWLYVAALTAPRDIKALTRFICLKLQVRSHMKKNISIGEIFQQHAKKHPNKPCLLFEDEEWTFGQVEEYSNRVASVFASLGFKKGDAVAIFLENRPEFVCLWLGLSKLGVIAPLINFNLRQYPLVHSIKASNCTAVIFQRELAPAIKDIKESLPASVQLYQWHTGSASSDISAALGEKDLPQLLAAASPTPTTVVDKPAYDDPLLYIYTSGTTGLPKAAVISHARFEFIAAAISWLAGFKNSDRFYTPLPLYHTAGGVMTIGQALLYGCTVVIRKKFSASAYFSDVKKYKCTVGQYIGEMCRYILAVPPKQQDKDHTIRLIFGNGLRPQIWKEFVKRFNIPRVAEFYGATEGNANIVNIDNTVGAIGFVSRIIPSVYPLSIIKVDPATGEPIRNAKGLCIECGPGEPGVFVGKIIHNDPSRAFLGYVDKAASQKKVIHNVLRKGDSAFISGDILVADKWGNLFFKDRTGDTFRWKGENVSTTEVEAVISNVANYRDSVVYGVQVPGMEGRAGMVAILDEDSTLDLKAFAEGLKQSLPSYARPIFLRILKKVDMTGTYKLKKKDLQDEGFDPTNIKDRLYYLSSNGTYELLTEDVFSQINNGKIRF
ncbi:long-chain fatty acid transport protein 1-like isoform X2 [Schistocerca nitens]|uniref:long-chain fatty acid transport protein 1-like isoform X2 n=1 Tax=Schistocerca nitens TaxID=7011 RepID=UPI00211758F1|nr:long-chain fatty acid transport protein 1-like isoform X2 [Schistocerca nitens]